MCRPVRCKTCDKTTWSGCGQHIEQVRAQVSADNWCPGHDTKSNGLLARLRARR